MLEKTKPEFRELRTLGFRVGVALIVASLSLILIFIDSIIDLPLLNIQPDQADWGNVVTGCLLGISGICLLVTYIPNKHRKQACGLRRSKNNLIDNPRRRRELIK
jgi:zinc transporter ZupT